MIGHLGNNIIYIMNHFFNNVPFLMDEMSFGTTLIIKQTNKQNQNEISKHNLKYSKYFFGLWTCYEAYPFKKQQGILGSNANI